MGRALRHVKQYCHIGHKCRRRNKHLQLDRGGTESFWCGCCSAQVSLKSPYNALQLLLLICIVPIERKQSFQTAASSGWDPATDSFKAIILKIKISYSESSVFCNIVCMSSIALVSQLCL